MCEPGTGGSGGAGGIDAPVDAQVDAAPDAAVDCTMPLACQPPSSAHVSLCGRVFQLEDSAGANRVTRVKLFDTIALVANPAGATPMSELVTDDCGRFAYADLPLPTSGFMAIATDDFEGTPDLLALTTISVPVSAGQTIPGINAWTFQNSADVLWSSQAALLGTTFAQSGVWVAIFTDPRQAAVYPLRGAPAAGVTVTRGGSTASADDFYFGDTTPLARSNLNSATSTGTNGTVLLRNTPSPAQCSGMGGLPSNCQWPIATCIAAPGLVFVQQNVAVLSSNPAMLCQ